jgi:hypothetical protein
MDTDQDTKIDYQDNAIAQTSNNVGNQGLQDDPVITDSQPDDLLERIYRLDEEIKHENDKLGHDILAFEAQIEQSEIKINDLASGIDRAEEETNKKISALDEHDIE